MIRTVASYGLLAVAFVGLLLGNFGLWAERTVFNTGSFTSTTSRVLDEPTVRDRAAQVLADELIARGEVDQRIESRLPTELALLAPQLEQAAREFVTQVVRRSLDRILTTDVEARVLGGVHGQVLAALEGDNALRSSGGQVYLDLRPVLVAAAEAVGVDANPDGGLLARADLPPEAGRVVIRTTRSASTGCRGRSTTTVRWPPGWSRSRSWRSPWRCSWRGGGGGRWVPPGCCWWWRGHSLCWRCRRRPSRQAGAAARGLPRGPVGADVRLPPAIAAADRAGRGRGGGGEVGEVAGRGDGRGGGGRPAPAGRPAAGRVRGRRAGDLRRARPRLAALRRRRPPAGRLPGRGLVLFGESQGALETRERLRRWTRALRSGDAERAGTGGWTARHLNQLRAGGVAVAIVVALAWPSLGARGAGVILVLTVLYLAILEWTVDDTAGGWRRGRRGRHARRRRGRGPGPVPSPRGAAAMSEHHAAEQYAWSAGAAAALGLVLGASLGIRMFVRADRERKRMTKVMDIWSILRS